MSRFHLAELARIADAQIQGDASIFIRGLNSLDQAGPDEISFYYQQKYRQQLQKTRAGAVILRPEDQADCPSPAVLISDNPHLSWAKLTHFFKPRPKTSGIDSSAIMAASAQIGADVSIGAYAVIGEGVSIGDGVIIGPHCYIADNSQIGAGSRLIARVTVLEGVRIGQNCIIHPGAVIGSDGFGLAHDGQGWHKIEHLGSVIIEDEVEIGANTTVDRGAIHDTVIKKGAKLDNQIQVAHNVYIGEHTAIAGCVGIAGSAKIGAHCLIGGGAGIAGHLEISNGVQVMGMALIDHSIKEAGIYASAMLAMPYRQWRKNMVHLRHLDQLSKKIKQLEQQIEQLKQESSP